MTKIEGEKRTIQYSRDKVFTFLCDFNNYKVLMPDKVINWNSDANSCFFTIDGMTDLGMRIIEKSEPNQIRIKDDGDSPFPFFMTVSIVQLAANYCDVRFILDAELSPVLKLMAIRPLNNLLNHFVTKLETLQF